MDHRRMSPVSIEEFRPETLDGIVGQSEAVDRLRHLGEAVRKGRIVPSSLILHGPPGVGKTTAARAFGREVLGSEWENSFNELDASDNRSADFVRSRIAPIAGQRAPRGSPFRIIFFDEAETLTPEAQALLRPLMEGSASTTVFILACNRLDGISEPLRSRCTVLSFGKVGAQDVRRALSDALSKSGLVLPPPTLESIVHRAGGVPREAIKLLIEEWARAG